MVGKTKKEKCILCTGKVYGYFSEPKIGISEKPICEFHFSEITKNSPEVLLRKK